MALPSQPSTLVQNGDDHHDYHGHHDDHEYHDPQDYQDDYDNVEYHWLILSTLNLHGTAVTAPCFGAKW